MTKRILAIFVLAAGCTPSIDPGTYYCGPDQLCPPDMACDGPTHVCLLEELADPFSCPLNSDSREPDDGESMATDLGQIACGEMLLSEEVGCLVDSADEDWFVFRSNQSCSGSNPRVTARIVFPQAFAQVAVTAYKDGATLGMAQNCTPSTEATGSTVMCFETPIASGEEIYLAITSSGEGDCNGDCDYNTYSFAVSHVLQ